MLATDKAKPKTSPEPHVQPHHRATPRPEERGGGDLHDSPRHRDGAHGQEVAKREVHADPEHHQHDADLRELSGELRIGDVAGRERPDDDASQKVAEDGREAQTHRCETADESES